MKIAGSDDPMPPAKKARAEGHRDDSVDPSETVRSNGEKTSRIEQKSSGSETQSLNEKSTHNGSAEHRAEEKSSTRTEKGDGNVGHPAYEFVQYKLEPGFNLKLNLNLGFGTHPDSLVYDEGSAHGTEEFAPLPDSKTDQPEGLISSEESQKLSGLPDDTASKAGSSVEQPASRDTSSSSQNTHPVPLPVESDAPMKAETTISPRKKESTLTHSEKLKSSKSSTQPGPAPIYPAKPMYVYSQSSNQLKLSISLEMSDMSRPSIGGDVFEPPARKGVSGPSSQMETSKEQSQGTPTKENLDAKTPTDLGAHATSTPQVESEEQAGQGVEPMSVDDGSSKESSV